jgi:LysR family glycine cleavage system transcriptional activator
MERADWRLWFEAQGIEPGHELKGPSFSDDYLMVRAAISGQGLALVRNVYAEDDMRTGRLAQAIDVQWPTRFAYYAVGAAEALQKPALRKFREWLVGEAASTSQN